jgi:hypothetical protein
MSQRLPHRHPRLLVGLACLVCCAAPAQAGTTTPQDEELQALVDELNALIAQGETARSADRRFLQNLRDLAQSYDNPWRIELLHDDFSDGDYTSTPAWQVLDGRFSVRRGYGLVSESVPAPEPAEPDARGDSGKELAMALLGELLKPRQEQTAPRPAAAPPPTRSLIYTPLRIGNAFALSADVESLANAGEAAFSVYQGSPDTAGYRLVFRPDAPVPLELQRYSVRGSAVVEAVRQLPAGDPHNMRLEWTRLADGRMRVSVNGSGVLDVTDRGLMQDFDGLAYRNAGGEFALRDIGLKGSR